MTGWTHRAATGYLGFPQRQGPWLRWLLAGIFAWSAGAESAETHPKAATTAAAPPPLSRPATTTFNSVPSGREALLLRRLWGIDDVHVRSTASGEVIRFSYRVVDVSKAKILNDKKAKPYLIVQKTGTRLEVPTTEKIGQLRQTADPENGREYWMVFGNSGRIAKPGDHVDIVIGAFRANELVVESSVPVHRVGNP